MYVKCLFLHSSLWRSASHCGNLQHPGCAQMYCHFSKDERYIICTASDVLEVSCCFGKHDVRPRQPRQGLSSPNMHLGSISAPLFSYCHLKAISAAALVLLMTVFVFKGSNAAQQFVGFIEKVTCGPCADLNGTAVCLPNLFSAFKHYVWSRLHEGYAL